MVHDCVIVPRLGGFVSHMVPASYRASEHIFYPMHKEIVFNTTLRHNDGLLSESYMKIYNVDYHKAYRMVEDDADEIREQLYKDKEVSLGTIGAFRLGNEGQVVFRPLNEGFQSMDSYGLPSFRLKTVQALQRELAVVEAEQKKAESDHVLYIPIKRKWLQSIAGVAAAITMFLVISTPVKQIDTETYTANFIPTEVVATSTVVTPQPTRTTAASVAPVQTRVQQPQSTDIYYVIVSSVNSVKQADQFIAGMDRSAFKRVDKLVESKKVRVYVEKFNDRDKADAYMAKLRKNPKYKDAWVYIP